MSPTAQQAFDRITAFKALTERSGTITYKSQRAILQSLNPTDLADVAIALQTVEGDALSGAKQVTR